MQSYIMLLGGSRKGIAFYLLAIVVIAIIVGAIALLLIADSLGFIRLSAYSLGDILTIELP